MATKMILTGDVNLMNVADPAVPFALVRDEFRDADIVFSNLECCLYQPPSGHSVEHEGFFADPVVAGEALQSAGISAVGIANNVNYGAAAIMRMPTRLHITWESDAVLRIDTDAGQQTRRLLFDKSRPAPAGRSLQGFSLAEWYRPARAGGAGRGGRGEAQTGPVPGANLKVVTNHLSGGWLRRNGVPYSEDAVVTEYFDRFATPTGDEWLVVTTQVLDPKYLNQDFVTSSHFKKEPDGSKWNPSPCKAS